MALAQSWDGKKDVAGYFLSEKLDGAQRAVRGPELQRQRRKIKSRRRRRAAGNLARRRRAASA